MYLTRKHSDHAFWTMLALPRLIDLSENYTDLQFMRHCLNNSFDFIIFFYTVICNNWGSSIDVVSKDSENTFSGGRPLLITIASIL